MLNSHWKLRRKVRTPDQRWSKKTETAIPEACREIFHRLLVIFIIFIESLILFSHYNLEPVPQCDTKCIFFSPRGGLETWSVPVVSKGKRTAGVWMMQYLIWRWGLSLQVQVNSAWDDDSNLSGSQCFKWRHIKDLSHTTSGIACSAWHDSDGFWGRIVGTASVVTNNFGQISLEIQTHNLNRIYLVK